MNALDKVIAYFAPSYGLDRALARASYEAMATYADANPGRLDTVPLAPGTSADWDLELGRDRRLLVDRVRQTERDNPFAGVLLDRTGELVVGHGFRLVPKTKTPKWNIKFMRLWREWCRKENADQRGLLGLHKMMSLSFRGYLRDGEAGWIKIFRRNEGKLRCLESDEIGSPEGFIRPGKVDGIDLDDDGKPKAYHIFKPDMNILYSDRRVSGDRLEVPAGDVIFWARRIRTSQTRGLSAFNTIFWALEQLKGSIEAMTVALRMAACVGLVIKRASPFQLPTAPNANSSTGTSRNLKLTPGGSIHLLPGEDVTTVTPSIPEGFDAHTKLLLRIACAPFGLPLEVAMSDFGPLNLSAARANLQQALRTARNYQIEVEENYDAIADWKALEWMECGELDEIEDWQERHWVKPKQLVMDPVAEEQADIAALDAGTKTYSQVAEERGTTIEELIEQRKMEKEMLEAAGLEMSKSTLTRDPAPKEAKKPGAVKNPQSLDQVKAAVRAKLIRRGPSRPRIRELPVSE